MHQTQAYIFMYRKTEQSTGMGKSAPIDIPKKLESPCKKNPNPKPKNTTEERNSCSTARITDKDTSRTEPPPTRKTRWRGQPYSWRGTSHRKPKRT